VLAKVNPYVLNERGSVVKEGTKGFDKVWVAVYPMLNLWQPDSNGVRCG